MEMRFFFDSHEIFVWLIFQTNFVLEAEEGDPVAIAVHPSGDDFMCSLSNGSCK